MVTGLLPCHSRLATSDSQLRHTQQPAAEPAQSNADTSPARPAVSNRNVPSMLDERQQQRGRQRIVSTDDATIDSRLRRTQQPAAEQAQSNADTLPARFRPARARSRSCLRRVVSLPPSVRALVSSSAGGPFARIRALASPSPSRMHVYPSVCGPLARNRALASLSGNGVFRENFPAIERTAVWSAICSWLVSRRQFSHPPALDSAQDKPVRWHFRWFPPLLFLRFLALFSFGFGFGMYSWRVLVCNGDGEN